MPNVFSTAAVLDTRGALPSSLDAFPGRFGGPSRAVWRSFPGGLEAFPGRFGGPSRAFWSASVSKRICHSHGEAIENVTLEQGRVEGAVSALAAAAAEVDELVELG